MKWKSMGQIINNMVSSPSTKETKTEGFEKSGLQWPLGKLEVSSSIKGFPAFSTVNFEGYNTQPQPFPFL